MCDFCKDGSLALKKTVYFNFIQLEKQIYNPKKFYHFDLGIQMQSKRTKNKQTKKTSLFI